MGSASMRLSEAKERDRLHKVLDGLDKNVSIRLIRIQRECGDIVTYKVILIIDKASLSMYNYDRVAHIQRR